MKHILKSWITDQMKEFERKCVNICLLKYCNIAVIQLGRSCWEKWEKVN